jgi:hypothetical protein
MSLLTGCAIGNKHNYRDVVATLPSTSGQSVAIATHDTRPYVLNSQKNPSFVGLQRGGYGNPFDVENENAEALSTSFSAAACGSIQASGGLCSVVPTDPFNQNAGIKTRLEQTGAPRLILFTLKEWKADTMLNTALHYDVTMDILSPAGTTLLTRRISGVDDLRGSFWNAPAYAKKAVPTAFKGKLEKLLGEEEVISTLRGTTPSLSKVAKLEAQSGPLAHTTCTVTQVLEMKKLGLSDSQIEKSCH